MNTYEILYRNNRNTLFKNMVEEVSEKKAVAKLKKEIKDNTGDKISIFMVIEK